MSSKVFLQSLQSKLKGGNTRSIHLNALPGRSATRLDLAQFSKIEKGLGDKFLKLLLTEKSFNFKVTFDGIDQNELSKEELKNLGLLSKRINSILIENEDYWKEHGVRTLGFGFPLLIKRSPNDPEKLLVAPLFIWSFDIVRSTTKVNEWTVVRNMTLSNSGKFVEAEQHQINVNEVLHSFVLGDEGIQLPTLTEDILEDGVVDKEEVLYLCLETINALNSGSKVSAEHLLAKFNSPLEPLPELSELKSYVNNEGYIHFGGVFGLFRAQKESIITDISRLLERFDDFKFDNLQFDSVLNSKFSAITTDPSQQSIISSLGIENNQIIQGPPGTGKSQSLTALITNALANNLRCLVVCEKKTALDVIKSNLERTDSKLSRLVAVIDDVNADREAIVDAVRENQNSLKVLPNADAVHYKYVELNRQLKSLSERINKGHESLSTKIFSNEVWSDLIGQYLRSSRVSEGKFKDHNFDKSAYSFDITGEELRNQTELLREGQSLLEGNKLALSSLDIILDDVFDRYPVSEGKVIVENFAANGLKVVAEILSEVEEELAQAERFWEGHEEKIPKLILDELLEYKPFLTGVSARQPDLPEFFKYEKELIELGELIVEYCASIKEIQAQYAELITTHYNSYSEELRSSIENLNSFVQDAENQFGPRFYINSSVEKFIEIPLCLFSSKVRNRKKRKEELIRLIPRISEVHKKQSYIAHSFNYQEQFETLHPYVENINELNGKYHAWCSSIEATVQGYLKEITPISLHKEGIRFQKPLEELSRKAGLIEVRIKQFFGVDISIGSNISNYPTEAVGYLMRSDEVREELSAFRNWVEMRSDNNSYYIEKLKFIELGENGEAICKPLFNNLFCLADWKQNLPQITELFTALETASKKYRAVFEWKRFEKSLRETEKKCIQSLIKSGSADWAATFNRWYLKTILINSEPENLPKDSRLHDDFRQFQDAHGKAQISSIHGSWVYTQHKSLKSFKERGYAVNSLYNKRGSKGQRRNSLRTIIKTDFKLFTNFFPVLLVNPSVCSSILPLEEGIFDVVIFDEASQLRIEDTYAALIRGKAKVVSGDKHQMPPSSYFEGTATVVDPSDGDEEFEDEEIQEIENRNAGHRDLAFSESLLDYAENKGYHQSFLDIHYRSQHPALIDFSNAAIYGNRLLPIPAKKEYVPIRYIEVNGLYEERSNVEEANAVVEILENRIEAFENGVFPTVGVATFNLTQRNLIIDKVNARRYESESFDHKMRQIGDSFFVKNLENIQGDERDVIILSTTFGRKRDGSFQQKFGPVGQSKGHRMLNVIVTRARHQMFVCTSFPVEYISKYPQLIEQYKNTKYGLIYAYLAYAKAVSEQNSDQRESILSFLSQNCSEKFYDLHHTGEFSESPFEEEVYQRLAQHIDPERIIQQHWVGGFRIDMVIKPKNPNGRLIALECDGAKYHSNPEAYAWDMFRQEQLEKTGLVFHRIWSTNWWDDAKYETEKLLETIKKHELAPSTLFPE